MPGITVEQRGGDELARDLKAAPEKIRNAIAKEAFAIGSRAVRYIREMYRSTGGQTSTWRRTGQLANSYDSQVKKQANDVELAVGAIKPTDAGKVPLHARVHEGFDAAGNRVSKFVIVPKRAPYLVFPIRQGGGMAKGNIVGWVRTKRVVLYPRPALEPTSPMIVKALEAAAGQAAADAL